MLRGASAELAELEHELKQSRQALERAAEHSLRRKKTNLSVLAGGSSRKQRRRLKGELLELMNAMAQARNEIRYGEGQTESLERRMSRSQEESGSGQRGWRSLSCTERAEG